MKEQTSVVLNEQDHYNKVYGGWLGKNIGGTLGAPLEGEKRLLELTYYSKLPDGPLENDDLDLQLVALHAMEQYGARLTAVELGQEWQEHVYFPFDEYGYALANLRRGLLPPVAGRFGNPFTHCMGSPIRSELWAMVAPATPGVAAYYAYQDAIVDHAGGEGVYGEVFFAAIESAAFTEQNRDRLIAIGLSYIPADCRTALAVNDLLVWHKEGKTWLEARELILKHHGRPNFTDAPQNIAFTILGWLYGEDFGDAILKAVNCGYDTDCTGATLGAILGIISGPEGLPDKWKKPVGDRIVVSPPIKAFPAPANLDELTRRTMRLAKEAAAVWNTGVVFAKDLPTTAGVKSDAVVPDELWYTGVTGNRYLLPKGSVRRQGLELRVDYGAEGPSIGRNGKKRLQITIANYSAGLWTGKWRLDVPAGWEGAEGEAVKLHPGEELAWNVNIQSPQEIAAANRLTLAVATQHNDSFWKEEHIPLSLVAACQWTLEGPDGSRKEVVCPTNRVDFEALPDSRLAGVYRASAKLTVPSQRDLKLIAATASPVKAVWNGRTLFDQQASSEFMPAYHRAPQEQFAEFTVPAGVHLLELEITKTAETAEEPLELYVLPVAQRSKEEPGSFFYYTDIQIG